MSTGQLKQGGLLAKISRAPLDHSRCALSIFLFLIKGMVVDLSCILEQENSMLLRSIESALYTYA